MGTTLVARRSAGSGSRATSDRASSASTTSVAERGAIRSRSASTESRTEPSSPTIRSARAWLGVTSYAAIASPNDRRIERAAVISRSLVESSLVGRTGTS